MPNTTRYITARNFIEKHGVEGLMKLLDASNGKQRLSEMSIHFHTSASRLCRARDKLFMNVWMIRPETWDELERHIARLQRYVDSEKKLYDEQMEKESELKNLMQRQESELPNLLQREKNAKGEKNIPHPE